ncbi:MAG: type II toxin-antitoxin system PemK/MazF family toxin [Gemmatimonadota bacterium]
MRRRGRAARGRTLTGSGNRLAVRWDLVWVQLDPVVGREQGGARPALVVSNDGFNARFDLVTVVPLTGARGKTRRIYPFEVMLPRGAAGNAEDSIAMPFQVRTITRTRVRGPIGELSDLGLREAIEARLIEHLGIAFAT